MRRLGEAGAFEPGAWWSSKDWVGLLNTTLGTRAFRSLLLSLPLLIASVVVMPVPTANAATSPTLGAAGSYSVLAGQTVTNTHFTTMPGDLGVSPGAGPASAPTGFPPGVVGPPGTIHFADFNAAQAQAANTAAFLFIDQTPCDPSFGFGSGPVDLTGKTLGPGVYCADAFTLTGTLTLLGGSGVWIFKSASTLITTDSAPGGQVHPRVVGGDPCNVWWREVSSAVLDTNTTFEGNILASTSITLKTGATLNGRALAQTGAVTLDTNTITGSACLTPNTGGPPVTPVTPVTPVVAPPKFTG
jgi:Ice-binding-like